MLRPPPTSSVDILIPRESWLKLMSGGLEDIHNPKEIWEVAAEAIDEWTRRHNPSGCRQVCPAGYQWKHLYLPPGTLLRTNFRGKNYHCLVEEDDLLYDGKPISPNGFVNAVGGVRRNAWRSIWVLYPKTTEWQLADSLRTRTRSPRARKPKVVAEQVQAEPVALHEGRVTAQATQSVPRAPSSTTFEDIQRQLPAPARHEAEECAPAAATPPASMHGDGGLNPHLLAELLPLLQRLCDLALQRAQSIGTLPRVHPSSFGPGSPSASHRRRRH